MALRLLPVLFIAVCLHYGVNGGVISEFEHSFGSFAKLPQLFRRWSHPERFAVKDEPDFPSSVLMPLEGETLEHPLSMNKRTEDFMTYEELPQPMHQKDSVKGYIRDDGTYIVEDSSGMPCVMAFFNARITVYYPINLKEEKFDNRIVAPPSDVTVSGKCDRDSLIAILDLSWPKGTFSLRFAFDDILDSWFVDEFKFSFNTSYYKGAEKQETVVLKSDKLRRFWTTSHAKSFRCLLLHDVSLMNDDETYSGTVHFDEARVQALTKTKTFKTPKHCIHRVHRNEMVPITVGGTMIGLTLLTIAGYGAFRYFKVKKFDYGTME